MGSSNPLQTPATVITRPQEVVKRKLIGTGDLVTLAMLIICTPVAVLLPQRALFALCRLAARALPTGFQQLGANGQIASALNISSATADEIRRRTLTARLISVFSFLRATILGPSFDIELKGKEHLDAALAEGHGVVLWVADQVYGADVGKIALFDRGYQVSHLSRPEHGFSDTRFGLKFLNSIRQNFELRFLRERIVFDRASRGAAADLMRERLADNGIVSIFASAYEGRALVEADFLNSRLRLAAGAPRLAFKAQCPILPLFIAPAPDFPAFEVMIGEPLRMTSDDKEQAVLEATTDFLDRFTPIVRQRPELWRAWPLLQPREVPSTCTAPIAARSTQPSLA